MPILNTNKHFYQICSAAQYCGLQQHTSLPKFDANLLVTHRPDAHWVVVEEGVLQARCSLWWNAAPPIPNGTAGLIGHYAAADDDSAARLLEFVCQQLARRGCTFAIGPMDQNTWRDYRFVVEEGNRPRFFLEPNTVPLWLQQWLRDGFTEIASYASTWVEDLTVRNPRVSRVRKRMEAEGIRIRLLDRCELETELKHIFRVVKLAFQDNPFYVPVGEADFQEMYRPLQHSIPTDLILLAEHGGKVIGFIFAVPDLLQAKRGAPIDTVIVKTFGVMPGRAYAGVGQALLEEVHQRAAAAGFRHAIHALVREAAHMNRIADRYGIPFRRYALLGKGLG